MSTGEDGKKHPVYMGSYGMSPTRLLGTIVEAMADEKGMVWPKEVAPFTVHLLSLSSKDEATQSRIDSVSTEIYDELTAAGVEVLWDDRDISPGAKFGDSDLIGIPLRLVVSSKTLEQDSVEWKERHLDAMDMLKVDEIIEKVKSFASEEAAE
jgi:prolyl-tRNA synthetase